MLALLVEDHVLVFSGGDLAAGRPSTTRQNEAQNTEEGTERETGRGGEEERQNKRVWYWIVFGRKEGREVGGSERQNEFVSSVDDVFFVHDVNMERMAEERRCWDVNL